jgi:urease
MFDFKVIIRNPICTDMGDLELALYGSFLPIPSIELFQVKYLRDKRSID